VPGTPVRDVIVLLPGITGSVLQKDGEDVWALSGGAAVQTLTSLGQSIKNLELDGDDPELDDLGDGVTAPRIIPDTHLIPGLWKIDGYGKIAQTIRKEFDVTAGVNYFEFPYDWRRDNRVHARRLASESAGWLKTWRERSGIDDAKLVLIGHSMGGLICRHFLELHDGWKDTRLLISLGTPYRGSLNALNFIANGMRKRLGPITLLNLTDVLRSFTSVYQLLPVYPCVSHGGGDLARVTEVEGIPGLDARRAQDALEFHRAIKDAVEANSADPAYRESGYTIKPIAGIFQPTSQSARLSDGDLGLLRTYDGQDQGGDGTVPSVSATPFELSNLDREIYVRERHASLQNADFSLNQVIGLLRRQLIDQARVFAPGTGISLDVEDAYLAGEPVVVRAMPEAEWATIAAEVRDAGSGAHVAATPLAPAEGGWREAELEPLRPGTYRVTVTGDGDGVNPVTDIFSVIEEGVDVEL
jgi:pimeloyl-ACP methyl ester carboxylesterase